MPYTMGRAVLLGAFVIAVGVAVGAQDNLSEQAAENGGSSGGGGEHGLPTSTPPLLQSSSPCM